MGGVTKVHQNAYGYGNNKTRRRKSFMLMLLVAFGAAMFGVLLVHKLREKRIFNLLLKEKDNQIISLHLFLQKERGHAEETKKKMEEMKAKIRSLRIQKSDLSSRILEMQSTISSLKDEQRTIELALEEKRNETNLLRENDTEVNLQVKSLSEIIRQKEAEIQDLKRHTELPVKVWSVGADDPSNSSANVTKKVNIAGSGEEQENRSKGADQKIESTKSGESKSLIGNAGSTRNESVDKEGGNQSESGGLNAERKEMVGEQSQSSGNLQENGNGNGQREQEGEVKGTTAFQSGVNVDTGMEDKNANETEMTGSYNDNQSKPRDEVSEARFTDTHREAEKRQLIRTSNYQGEKQELRADEESGKKLELQEYPQGTSYRLKGIKRARGRRWRTIARHVEDETNAESNRIVGRTRQRFIKGALGSRTRHGEGNMVDESALEHDNSERPHKIHESTDLNQKPDEQADLENNRLNTFRAEHNGGDGEGGPGSLDLLGGVATEARSHNITEVETFHPVEEGENMNVQNVTSAEPRMPLHELPRTTSKYTGSSDEDRSVKLDTEDGELIEKKDNNHVHNSS